MLISLDDISLPTTYYTEEQDRRIIQEKIEEYYKNGDFVHPLIVRKTSYGYILEGNYEQFRAAQELDITECICSVVS